MDFHLLNSELLKLRVFDGKQYKGKEKPEKKRGSRIWRTLKVELRNLGNKEPSMILNLNLYESLPLCPQLCIQFSTLETTLCLHIKGGETRNLLCTNNNNISCS